MKILVPLPSRDFDPTEVAIPWQVLRDAGHVLVFATPDGARGHADPRMLSGEGLDPWGFVPGLRKLRAVGLLLRARADARAAYADLERDEGFAQPLRHADLDPAAFDALLLPGGHAPGMRPYLESADLQRVVAALFDRDAPVAAICHGVVLAARSVSPRTGRSVLHGRRTTALTWALERSAFQLCRWFARPWDPGYYRTYAETADQPFGFNSVEGEVTRALREPDDFLDVPDDHPDRRARTGGIARDTATDPRPAWVVRDGHYVSARWPGDAWTFARTFVRVLAEPPAAG
jgi:putative intracellular protease/amidase